MKRLAGLVSAKEYPQSFSSAVADSIILLCWQRSGSFFLISLHNPCIHCFFSRNGRDSSWPTAQLIAFGMFYLSSECSSIRRILRDLYGVPLIVLHVCDSDHTLITRKPIN